MFGGRKHGMAERVGQAIKAQRISVVFADPNRELPPSMHAYVRVERGPGTRNARSAPSLLLSGPSGGVGV